MKKELFDIIAKIESQLSELKAKVSTIIDPIAPVVEQKIVPVPVPDINNTDKIKSLRDFINNPSWAVAVPPDLICDETNNEDKMDRARGIRDIFYPNFSYAEKKILDFGTGYGHLVQAISEKNPTVVVGYDIKDNFQIASNEKQILTTSWDEVVNNAPYDLIYIYDVIDHVENESPQEILRKAKLVLSSSGVIRMRCHPYISKHGGHTYNKINKGYAHLILSKDELVQLGHDFKNFPTIFVTTPVMTYGKFISESNLRILDAKTVSEPADAFFLTGNVANRIKSNLNIKNLLIPQMGMQFLDYTLS
jgi:2-polyprenyl-3-methyl-5-hydroxy-6-metoxy-1,4-benzoquinol methylase